jgi:hypothetical protein
MKEYEARRAVLKSKVLTNADKVVMFAILQTINWQTWESRICYTALAMSTGRNRGNISKNVTRLERLGYVQRDWFSSEKKTRSPVMKVNLDKLAAEEDPPKRKKSTYKGVSSEHKGVSSEHKSVSLEHSECFPRTQDAVSSEHTIQYSYNNNLLQSNINMYGLNVGELWGDELRDQVEEDLRAKKEGEE